MDLKQDQDRPGMESPNKYASPEEMRYARVLEVGATVGLVALALSFVIYLLGVLPPLVPLEDLPKYWTLSAREFVQASHSPTGWDWLRLIGKGDILSLGAIAFLAGLSALCSLAVLPLFVRRGELAHAIIIVLQIAVLVLAASNLLGR
jgi:hypothetical protein